MPWTKLFPAQLFTAAMSLVAAKPMHLNRRREIFHTSVKNLINLFNCIAPSTLLVWHLNSEPEVFGDRLKIPVVCHCSVFELSGLHAQGSLHPAAQGAWSSPEPFLL